MFDFKDEGVGIGRTFGDPRGNVVCVFVFFFFLHILVRILIAAEFNFVTFVE